MKKKKKDWLKLKKYPHFSPRFKLHNIPFIRSYVGNEEKVALHRFYPFIHYSMVEKKYRRGVDKKGKKEKLRTLKTKSREIYYANHLDSQVFAYYAHLLNEELNKFYSEDIELDNCVIAYRAIEHNENRNKCSIDFAKEVFDFIKEFEGNKVTAICIDVKSFFDSLDHEVLKNAWCRVLKKDELPPDHFNVYKAITRFSYVEISDILKAFPELNVKAFQNLKRKGITAFCENPKEFRDRIVNKKLIRQTKFKASEYKKNREPRRLRKEGIPQGSPISAALSNVYMLELDQVMKDIALQQNGLYRRYSDDIILILPNNKIKKAYHFLKNYISENLKLTIQDAKTQEVVFQRLSPDFKWTVYMVENKLQKLNKGLEYLGLEFNGETTRIKQKSISKYYRTVKKIIRRKAYYAKAAKRRKLKTKNPDIDAWIFRTGIYKKKSHLGCKRKTIQGKVFWGNYYSYAKTASKIIDEPAIKKQLKNHWRIIDSHIKHFEKKYGLDKTPSRRGKKKSSSI